MVLPSSTRSSENAPSPLPSPSTIDPSALLQRARSWTAQHLDVAKVKIIEDMTAWEFLGAEYVPADGDLGLHDFISAGRKSTDILTYRI